MTNPIMLRLVLGGIGIKFYKTNGSKIRKFLVPPIGMPEADSIK